MGRRGDGETRGEGDAETHGRDTNHVIAPPQRPAGASPRHPVTPSPRHPRTLLIGYGNPSRRDDGVGLTVVNGVRERLGLPSLGEGDDGFDDLSRSGATLDTLFLQQLTPELAETVAAYDRLILVDAHTGILPDLIHRAPVLPRTDPAPVSHHLKPDHLLALTKLLYGKEVTAEVISIRGLDFNFGVELSPGTEAGVRQVIDVIWEHH